MRYHPRQAGFTAVELLITIIVGVIFLTAIGQIYTVVINDASASRSKATASSLAYTLARKKYSGLGTVCSGSTNTLTLNASYSLPLPASASTVVDCPYSPAGTYGNNTVWRIVVTVSYGSNSPQLKVQHVLYKN